MEPSAPTQSAEQHTKRFSPKTLALIIVLTVIAVALIVFALRMNSSTKPVQVPEDKQAQVGPTSAVEKTAKIVFSPASVDLTTSTSASADIIVTAGNIPITGVQVEINYDPQIVRNPRIIPPDPTVSLFGPANSYLELFNEIDNVNGSIKFALGIQPTGNPVVGAGSIGKLTFSVARGTSPSSRITFGESTAVTIQGSQESVLSTTTPLTITLQ